QYESLIPANISAKTINLRADEGFEPFIDKVIQNVEKYGNNTCYIFDLLSDLITDWYSDVIMGDFFSVIAPFISKFDTITLFTILRNKHEDNAMRVIQKTARIVLESYLYHKVLYIQPIKVKDRFTPILFNLHKWDFKSEIVEKRIQIKSVKESSQIAKILTKLAQPWVGYRGIIRDNWHSTFQQAERIFNEVKSGKLDSIKAELIKNRLLRMVVVRDDRFFIPAVKYFDLEDLLNIGKRQIGTGFIGGKAAGMMLAQAILKKADPKWKEKLEIQDSYFIGCGVYYSFIIWNNLWWDRRKVTQPNTFLQGIEKVQQKIMRGTFPQHIINQFIKLLNYFGQSPIIVRSSSLQEDAYGNSFSGKYESIFLPNQGTLELRFKNFLIAARTIYASTISEDALTYRKARRLLDVDEEMGLLVQRVSGSIYGKYFLPQIAGTGFSFNPFVWDKRIDPKSGFLRLVVGLGTRAVDRTDDDFTRFVAINNPSLNPISDPEDQMQYTQKKLDLIDLEASEFTTIPFKQLIENSEKYPLEMVATRDLALEKRALEFNHPKIFSWIVSFDNLLNKTDFLKDMQEILQTVQEAYQVPVDMEYTVNFLENGDYKINLLQCRPFQIKMETAKIKALKKIPPKAIIIKTTGPIIGTSLSTEIDRIIYVTPHVYGKLPMRERYSIARLIGKINRLESSENKKILLMGPGRWGTTSPSLGLPVNFSEIDNISIICEIAEMREGLIPDMSLGSHFFNNLVELDMVYFALFPDKENCILNRDFFDKIPNRLGELIPDANKWEHALKIIDLNNESPLKIKLYMNSIDQDGYIYLTKKSYNETEK
ncbi:MAG: PEP/pyruvate-binding domain-containing protein, partial [Promethearchaeota archaeon]